MPDERPEAPPGEPADAPDYSDPRVPAAAADADRKAHAKRRGRRAEPSTRDPDPDEPTDRVWSGNTLRDPGPGD